MSLVRSVRWAVGEDTQATAGDVSTHGWGSRGDMRVGCVLARL